MAELITPILDKITWFMTRLFQPGDFDVVVFGRSAVLAAVGFYGLTLVLGIVGNSRRDRRWIVGARNSIVFGSLSLLLASTALVACFVQGRYDVKYVFGYSEKALALPYKIAGLWAGLDGSMLFWSTLTGILVAVVAAGFVRDARHPVARRIEGNVYIVLAVVQLFFICVLAFVADPFRTHLEFYGVAEFAQLFPLGNPLDGSGLNPLLENYWMVIHPPCLYAGFVTYTIPFAFGIAALLSGEQGSFWVQKTRRWMLVGWLFNTSGCILGGLWAYEVLSWGGYWAWDPVETASFLPWFAATAFLHSVMVQERRDMLRTWNVFLVCLTWFLTVFATWLTRSGVVSSVHAFSSGSVGDVLQMFLWANFFIPLGLIAYRFKTFGSRNRIESLLSRESFFVLNNMILVAIALGNAILVFYPKISNELFGEAITVSIPVYNTVNNPFFVVMFFFLAVGPAMGWMKTSRENLLRNLLGPALLAAPIAVIPQYTAFLTRAGEGVPLAWWEHMYPTYIINYLAVLAVLVLAFEFARSLKSGIRRGDNAVQAALHLLIRNNRRYGGYIVHLGLATLAVGVVNSSMFRVKHVVNLGEGGTLKTGRYEIRIDGVIEDLDVENKPYQSTRLQLTITSGARTWHMEPERRLYPATQFRPNPQPTTELALLRGPLEDLYISFHPRGDRTSDLTVFRNPLVSWVWLGWVVMIFGGVWAALPMGRRRVGLTD